MRWLGYNAFPIVCVISGAFLAATERPGWVWLFVIAVMTAVYPAGGSSHD